MLLDFLAFRHGELLDPAEVPFTSCGRCEVASIFNGGLLQFGEAGFWQA
jgi:hypothetical protein